MKTTNLIFFAKRFRQNLRQENVFNFSGSNKKDNSERERDLVNTFCVGHNRLQTNQDLEEFSNR